MVQWALFDCDVCACVGDSCQVVRLALANREVAEVLMAVAAKKVGAGEEALSTD